MKTKRKSQIVKPGTGKVSKKKLKTNSNGSKNRSKGKHDKWKSQIVKPGTGKAAKKAGTSTSLDPRKK